MAIELGVALTSSAAQQMNIDTSREEYTKTQPESEDRTRNI